MKLSKDQIKRHNQALEYLKNDFLSFEEKLFVYENWQESATHVNSSSGAFFTPFGLARDFSIELGEGFNTVDLCAGIGMLSFVAYHFKGCHDITCIELNPDYIKVGKKLLPEAKWIQGSIMDRDLIESLGHFKQSISNPPFGDIKHNEDIKGWLKYNGSKFDLKTIEVASKVSDIGIFILPQMSTPFRYSGRNGMMNEGVSNYVKQFIDKTGFEFNFNCGIDTSVYKDDWKGVSPICEIVQFEFPPVVNESKQASLF